MPRHRTRKGSQTSFDFGPIIVSVKDAGTGDHWSTRGFRYYNIVIKKNGLPIVYGSLKRRAGEVVDIRQLLQQELKMYLSILDDRNSYLTPPDDSTAPEADMFTKARRPFLESLERLGASELRRMIAELY